MPPDYFDKALSKTMQNERTGHLLRNAASSGDIGTVRKLLAEDADVNDRDSFNNTALLYAAKHGKFECVRLLIEHGADTNIANENGYTPLICAAIIGAENVVGDLLKAGADVQCRLKDDKSQDNSTALSLARYRCRSEVVNLLISYGATE